MSESQKPGKPNWSPRDFRYVLSEELKQVGDAVAEDEPDAIKRAHRKQLVGLAFSGGGIRSATFNLGVLQALAQMRLLSKFDYLSTVSGGGYIGSWLIAWMKRRGVKDVHQSLCPEWIKQPGHTEPDELRFLRQFSNYLTPKLGWLGADMWTVIATYLRNLALNLVVLISAMTVLLLLPRLVALLALRLWNNGAHWWGWTIAAILAVFLAAVVVALSLRFFRLRASDRRRQDVTRQQYDERDAVLLFDGTAANNWKRADGNQVKEPIADAVLKGDVWYDKDYHDFILRIEFRLEAGGRSECWLWQKRNGAAKSAGAVVGGFAVKIGGESSGIPSTGQIEKTAPVRPATLRPAWNDLEITCVKEKITVRINDETVNTERAAREGETSWWLRRLGGRRWKPGVIGFRQTEGVHFRRLRIREMGSMLDAGGTQEQIQLLIVLPLFLAAFLGIFLLCLGDVATTGLSADTPLSMRAKINPFATAIQPWSWMQSAFATGGIAGGLFFLARLLTLAWEKLKTLFSRGKGADRSPPLRGSVFWESFCLAVAGLVGGVGVRALYPLFKGRTLWEVTAWGTPALISLSMLTLTLHIGLRGRAMPDQVREWWSRLGAWLLIYTLFWMALCAIVFYASPFFDYVNSLALSAGWLASTIWGVFAARSSTTGSPGSSKIRDFVAQAAPYIFIIGLFLFLSWGIDLLIPRIAGPTIGFNTTPEKVTESLFLSWGINPLTPFIPGSLTLHGTQSFSQILSRHWWIMDASNTLFIVSVMIGLAGFITLVFSLRLDINQFSMHLLYRNRLGRCYLGASNRLRRAQPFTGFAADDDFDLWELDKDLIDKGRMTAPYLIINAALNLVGGKELAWQQRKAASFVFTPKYCGYEFPELPPGYSATENYAAIPSPVTLGTAMAISGAAASPNMGYHTSPASAFLMTVFNVRLGWWLGNTRKPTTWTKSSPGNVLLSLLFELFGLTSDEGSFIYLSDGGHFENLGIYELVRRRCRFIVACDAEEDHSFGFGGLGNAIEKCRADLGIDLEIDVEPIRQRTENGHSQWHCAIGKIHYSRVDENGRDGMLVYLKSSLTGDEPTDVLRYAAENREFPHQTTGDQWFDESQFESYRALGFHIAQKVFGAVDAIENLSKRTKEELFVELAQRWYPPSAAIEESFTKHTRAVAAIYEELRTDKNLAFLSEQIYPQWRTVLQATYPAPLPRSGERLTVAAAKALREEEFRAGFYICNSVLQVMESVYLDLRLEQESDHPDNRGWMNFFRHWSWAPMFRVTWTISAGNYGARFQSFCERHLNLKIGQIVVDKLEFGLSTKGIERWLNKTERELIDLFLKHNPALTECAEIYALQLSPDVGSDPDLSFPFGFAILATTNLPEAPPLLVYFRVQDHLRKMGLARQALEALLKQKPALEAKLYEMNPKAHEVPTLDDQTEFDMLFDSVKTEMRQKGEKKPL